MPACPQAADAADAIARGQEQRRREFELTACAGTLRGMTGQRLWFSGSSSGNGSRVCCFKEGSLTRIFRKFSRAC